MIKKIIKIKGVGRFTSFASNNDDLAFNKDTIIFGYNTYGKSTLTAIFRSLKENNPNCIYGRKTFGLLSSQEIEILNESNQKFIFSSNWENKNIEIFDNDFISKNVFYGDLIDKEQQSSFYDILIGEEVYRLKNKIYGIRKEQEDAEMSKKEIENKFLTKKLGLFKDFLETIEDVDIDSKINETRNRIKQQENIGSLKLLISKTQLRSSFSNFKSEFTKTLDLSVEEKVNIHIDKNWKDVKASKDFLNRGLDLIKDGGGCVFCGQDLRAVEGFINDLRKVFSDEYRNLKQSINEFGDRFISIDLEKIFLEFEKYGLILNDKLDYEKLLLAKENINKKIRGKQNDLNLKLDFDNDQDFIIFLGELKKIHGLLDNIESQSASDAATIAFLKQSLNNQELVKFRFSEEGISIFDKHGEVKKRLELKKDEIKKLNLEITEKVNNIFKENEKQINFFLKELGSNFFIENFSPKSHMGLVNTHFCDFQFMIDNTLVNISNKARKDDPEPEDKPSFRNTLSDSDKRILAFAFYLAKLSNDTNLNSKIIVLDDPFSSFDENRKEATAKLIATLKNKNGDEPEQKIILTHDISFLCRLFNKLDKTSKTLKINYSLKNGSTLEICDVERDFLKEDYFKDMEFIKNSIEKSININEALKKVRPCLEHILKRKYYFLLKPETIKKKSIKSYLDEIGDTCSRRQEILDENWHEDMHDCQQIIQLSDPEKIKKLKDFLELVKEI